MNLFPAIAVFVGAGIGAWLRWWLGHVLNPVFPTLPLGTLAANVIGGLLIGCALGLFTHYDSLPPTVRLAVTTGFLGGLTTFSTFSAESVSLLLGGQYRWAAALISLHVAGSLLATLAGMASIRWLFKALGGAS